MNFNKAFFLSANRRGNLAKWFMNAWTKVFSENTSLIHLFYILLSDPKNQISVPQYVDMRYCFTKLVIE